MEKIVMDSPWFCERTLLVDGAHAFDIKISIPYEVSNAHSGRSWTCDISFSGYEFDFETCSSMKGRFESFVFEQRPFAAFLGALSTISGFLHPYADRITWLSGSSFEAAFPKTIPSPYSLEKYTVVVDECASMLRGESCDFPTLGVDSSIHFTPSVEPPSSHIKETIKTRTGPDIVVTIEKPLEISPHSWGCVMHIEGLGYSSYLHRLNERPCGYDSIDAVIARMDLLAELLEPHLLRIAKDDEVSPASYFRRHCPSFLSRDTLRALVTQLEALRENLIRQDF